MTTVLIADASKPSVVMTSEVFKDKIPGTIVHVAPTGQEAVRMAGEVSPDLIVVDFDLPDVDGPALVEHLRKNYDGPILLTAYPDHNVTQAVEEHMFAFNDASAWVPKPVNFDVLAEKIDRFLTERQRIFKRFDSELETQLIAKAAGRGKRAPKVNGKVVNISLTGACVRLEGTMKMKKAQELTLTVSLPGRDGRGSVAKKKTTTAKKKATKATKASKAAKKSGTEAKIKAKVAWIASGEVGLVFSRLTDVQKNGLVSFLKSC